VNINNRQHRWDRQIPGYRNVILSSLVLTHYQHVTDRPPAAKSRSNIAERDNNNITEQCSDALNSSPLKSDVSRLKVKPLSQFTVAEKNTQNTTIRQYTKAESHHHHHHHSSLL